MCRNWGYERLAEKIYTGVDRRDEARRRAHRALLFLDGLPNLQRLGKLNIGTTVHEILKNDLALEMLAIPMLNPVHPDLPRPGDNGSEDSPHAHPRSEEEHVDWLEAQLELIAQVGEAQYLAQQIQAMGEARATVASFLLGIENGFHYPLARCSSAFVAPSPTAKWRARSRAVPRP